MSCATLHSLPLAPSLRASPDFLDQCALLSIALLARLEALLQSSADVGETAKAAYQDLDHASRILKRIQETYISARKALREGETPSATEFLPPQDLVGSKPSRPINGSGVADLAALTIPSRSERPHSVNRPSCAPAASPLDDSRARAIAPPLDSPAMEGNLLTPASTPPPSDAMAKILASVVALETRYAASSAESPLVARLTGAAHPLSPPYLGLPLPALSSGDKEDCPAGPLLLFLGVKGGGY